MPADLTNPLEVVEIDINPTKTTLEELLNLAEAHKAGTIVIKGEEEDGSVQWGIVVVCSSNAGEIVRKLQITVDESIAAVLAPTAN